MYARFLSLTSIIGLLFVIWSDNSVPPILTASAQQLIETALLAPVSAGQQLTVIHGYNDPLPNEPCVIGSPSDHCDNQQYGLDLRPSNQADRNILAPLSGQIAWITGDCLGIRTTDNLNLTVCHFGEVNVSVNANVNRGVPLGTRSTTWIHLSLDDRYRDSSRPPVPFNGSHTLEGQSFDPPSDEATQRNLYNGAILNSTNGAGPRNVCGVNAYDACVDLGNTADESFHTLVNWGTSELNGPIVPPSGDVSKRYQALREESSVQVQLPAQNSAYVLTSEVEDGLCDDTWSIYVNGRGPIYTYSSKPSINTGIAHTVLIRASYISSPTAVVTFRNLATDSCGIAAVFNIKLQQATLTSVYLPFATR